MIRNPDAKPPGKVGRNSGAVTIAIIAKMKIPISRFGGWTVIWVFVLGAGGGAVGAGVGYFSGMIIFFILGPVAFLWWLIVAGIGAGLGPRCLKGAAAGRRAFFGGAIGTAAGGFVGGFLGGATPDLIPGGGVGYEAVIGGMVFCGMIGAALGGGLGPFLRADRMVAVSAAKGGLGGATRSVRERVTLKRSIVLMSLAIIIAAVSAGVWFPRPAISPLLPSSSDPRLSLWTCDHQHGLTGAFSTEEATVFFETVRTARWPKAISVRVVGERSGQLVAIHQGEEPKHWNSWLSSTASDLEQHRKEMEAVSELAGGLEAIQDFPRAMRRERELLVSASRMRASAEWPGPLIEEVPPPEL
jgi:hypothetical protein